VITLLDYGAGNVRSVTNAIEKLGGSIKVVAKPKDVVNAEKLIFPGVGSFGSMMHILEKKGYVDPLKAFLQSGKPFFGICLGMQALFESSEEAPGIRGLGIFKGLVKQFQVDRSVPHIGWNGVNLKKSSHIFNDAAGSEKYYFVHSFYVAPAEQAVILTTTDYGLEFVSSVESGSVTGTQFHPEKSGEPGLALLRNFISDAEPASMPPVATSHTELAKRIIACLDVRANDQGDLVVTKGDQYDVREKGAVRNLGQPVDLAARYYIEGADEITFLNITGFRDFPLEDMPMLRVLEETSRKVFVPLTIGGGIRDYVDKDGRKYSALEVAAQYFRSGADKISIGSDAVLIAEAFLKSGRRKTGLSAIEEISRVYGNQAVVISIDPRRVYVHSPDETRHPVVATSVPGPSAEKYCWFQCTIKGGREGRDMDAATVARVCEELGAGEILLNCIDKDGTNSGFDVELINTVRGAVSIPVIASSGAGCVEHFHEVFAETDAEAALAAGIFHRREVPIGDVKSHLDEQGVPVRT